MHCAFDLLGGLVIPFLYILFGWQFFGDVENEIIQYKFSPIVIIMTNFCLGWFYPNGDCASRKDTVIILGVGAGVNVATWANYYFGLDYDQYAVPELHIAFFRLLHGILLTVGVREIAKSLLLSLFCRVHGEMSEGKKRMRNVEVPLQFITYTAVGFTATFAVPLLFLGLGLYR